MLRYRKTLVSYVALALALAAMSRWLHEPSVDLEQELATMLRFFLAAAREAA